MQDTTTDNLKVLLDAIGTKYIGNRDAVEAILLGCVSAHPTFDIKLNVSVVGSSDGGKTACVESVLSIVHPKNKYPYNRVSPKAILYAAKGNERKGILPESFKNKVIFLDDITKETTEVLKAIGNTSNIPPSYVTVIDGTVMSVKLDAQPVVITTAVEFNEDHEGQCDRRFFAVEIKTNPDVKKFIIERACKNIVPEATKDMIGAQALLDTIMNTDTKVEMPVHDYAFCKTNTDVKFFIAMGRAIAKIRNPTAGTITATKEDIEEAARLFKANDVNANKLKSGAQELLNHIPDTEPTSDDLKSPETSPHTVEAIYTSYTAEHPGIGIRQIRRYLESLVAKSEVSEIPGQHGRKYYYAV